MFCQTGEEEHQVENYNFNADLITKVLSCLSIRIHLKDDRKIGKWTISTIPLPLCSFIILDVLALFGEYFYIRDSLNNDNMFMAAQVTSHFLSNAIDLAKVYTFYKKFFLMFLFYENMLKP